MKELKTYKFIRTETKSFGWRTFTDYVCHNGEKEVKKTRKEVVKLIKENRINLTLEQMSTLGTAYRNLGNS